jgi:hypothetical protein
LISGTLDSYWKGGANLRGVSIADYDVPYRGRYFSFAFEKSGWKGSGDFNFEGEAVQIGGTKVEGIDFKDNLLRWSQLGGEANSAEIQFSIDPTTQLPKFVGYVWEDDSRPKNPNLQGTFALETNHGSTSGAGPVGRYTTSKQLPDGSFGPGGPVVYITASGAEYYVAISA